jgi:hypothetical protein
VGYATEGNPPPPPPPGEADEGITAKLYLKTISVDDGWCALAVDIPLTAYALDQGHDLWHVRTGVNYKRDVTELVLGGDLAGLTAIPNRFVQSFSNLAAVDLSGLSGVTSVGYSFLEYCHNLPSVDLSPLSGVTGGIGTSFLREYRNLTSPDLTPLSPRYQHRKCLPL